MVEKYLSNVIGFPIAHKLLNRGTDLCVNWRRGSLRDYESIAGVAAKFCYLNRVGPGEFIRFCERFIARFRPNEFWMLFDRNDFDFDRFASILGEPNSCIAHLRQAPFRPPEEYVGCNIKLRNEDSSTDIVYCPDCIKFGYHAIFHQLPWMNKCLIHGSRLLRARGFDNKSYVRRDFLLIKDVYRLFFGEESTWNYDDYDSWGRVREIETSRSISFYLSAIEEVSLNGSLIKKQAKEYGGDTPKGSSRVPEIFRRLGGESTNRLLDRGYLSESSPSIRATICLDPHYYDRLTNISFGIGEIAAARKEWAILLGEETTWTVNAVSAIEAMLRNHQSCWSLYSRIKRKHSTSIHKSDIDFLRYCQRVVDVRHLQEQWLVSWLHREDFMEYNQDSTFLSIYSYIGRELERCGLANKADVKRIAIDPNGEAKIFSVDAWDLDHGLTEVLDSILRIQLVAQLWSIFDHERKDDKYGYEGFSTHRNDGVDWCLYETGSSSGELEIWSIHGEEMPDWGSSLDGVQHNPEGR